MLTAEALAPRSSSSTTTPAAFRKVFTLGQFAEAVARLTRRLAGRELLRALGERRGAAEPRARRARPLPSRARGRRGSAAEQIDELLRVVVPALDRDQEGSTA